MDSNTTREAAAHVLRGIEDGDPLVLDGLPSTDTDECPIHGEQPVEEEVLSQIAHAAGFDARRRAAPMGTPTGADRAALLSAYADAFQVALVSEVERACHALLGVTPDPSPYAAGEYVRSLTIPGVALVVDAWQGDQVLAHMRGDDVTHVIDPSTLAHLPEDAFCHGCGQLGPDCEPSDVTFGSQEGRAIEISL